MKTNGFNVVEYFYYKGNERCAFLLKYVMDPSLVEERTNQYFVDLAYDELNEFTDTLIMVGRNNGFFNI